MIKTKSIVRPRMTLVCDKCANTVYSCYKCKAIFRVNDEIYCCSIRCEHFCKKCHDEITMKTKGR